MCAQCRRLRTGRSHGHWKTSTFVAGPAQTSKFALFVLDRPINRLALEIHAEKALIGEMRPGDIVILDSLYRHVSKST